MPRDRSRTVAPLYDPAFEHDACGIGFVADAGGRRRDEVLGLALGGLAALGHRGAFGADGESSDGAGIALPLEPALLELVGGPTAAGERSGVATVFLPRGRGRATRARRLIAEALAEEGLDIALWRRVPVGVAALGAEAASSRPDVAQAVISRPDDPASGRAITDSAFERRLVVARRRLEEAARGQGLEDLSVPSMSCRTIVYKGLVAGGRLAAFYPDLAQPMPLSYALFHQRYATNTQPTWRLAQPFRAIAHNGEIDTVRGNREQVRGRTGDAVAGRAGTLAQTLVTAGPLLAPDGSDSQSLDEMLELLVATGWDLGSALLAAMPGGVVAAPRTASPRRHAPAGNRRIPRPVGRPGRHRLLGRAARRRDSRPERAPARVVRGDRRQAGRRGVRGRRDPAARVADRATRPVGPGRDAPRRSASRGDPRGRRREGIPAPAPADPRRAAARPCRPRAIGTGPADAVLASLPRRPRRREGPPRHQDDGDRGPRATLVDGRRHAAGRPRPRRPAGGRSPPPVVRPGHEPADRPGAGAGGHGPAGGPRPAAGAPRRATADRAAVSDAAAGPAGRGGPRGAAGRVPGARAAARRDVGPVDREPRARGGAGSARGGRGHGRHRVAWSCSFSPTGASRRSGCRSRRSSRSAR